MKPKISRRKFVIDGLTTLGVVMLPFPRNIFAQTTATATKGVRQHLVNLIDIGGWDSSWYFSFFDPAINSKIENTPVGWTPLGKVRYSTSDGIAFGGGTVAPGMKFWNATDFSRTLLWRGSVNVSGHGQNQFIFGGGVSPYCASHSALVATYQADTRGTSPLHYVKLSNSPTDLFCTWGMLTGVGIPSCLPNQTAWKTLTTPPPTATTPVSKALIESSIAQLSAAAQARLNRAASISVASSYSNGYSASVSLSNSNYATSDAFLSMWLRYYTAMQTEAANQLASGYGKIGDFQNDFVAQGVTVKGFNTLYGPLSKKVISNTTDLLTLNNSPGDAYISLALTIAWKFAITAFLVINDLSAVVDLNPTSGDNHYDITDDPANRLLGLAGARELTRHLSTVPNPEGGMLIDKTLITYTSEFDRSAPFASDNRSTWGTSHGTTFTALMMGHRSNGGHILGNASLGDLKTGNVDPNFINANGFGIGLPFDPVTGKSSPGGSVLSPFSFLPTVLAMFGATLPSQQITESGVIPFCIKSS
jgi:hypothetical protein